MELSVQSQVIVCPKCQHKRVVGEQGPDWQCPSCGIAYNKAVPPSPAVVHKVNNTSNERGGRENNRDGFGTATPGAISLSIDGRIGRLRYLAFSWPTAVLGSLLAIVAAVIAPRNTALGMTLLIVAGILMVWLSLRLMALRMHDLNRSSKWLLGLILLPGAGFAVGGPTVGTMCCGVVWFVALLLIVAPGSEDDNDYGPPPGANTLWVKIGAAICFALMALGVVANIKYIQYTRSAKLNAALSKQHDTVAGAPGPGEVQNGSDIETQKTARLRDFVGTWQGQDMSLTVDRYGNSDFRHRDGGRLISAYGPLQVLDARHISIGIGPTPQVLTLAVAPHIEEEVASMTLDGVALVRNK